MEAKMIRVYIRIGILILGMGFCSFLLYRLTPPFLVYRFLHSLFSFLVSSSPIIVCTAALLGTLFTFGQLNVPQLKEEENQTPATSLRTQSTADDLVVEKVARVEEKAVEEAGFGNRIEEVLIGKRPVIEDSGKEINGDKQVIEVENRKFLDDFEGDSNDHQKEIMFQQFNVHNDSGSDNESSSPDSSMTDVIPTLDELQPLIETDVPIPSLRPQDESDAQESDISSADLVGDVNNANEEAQERAAVTRTEDDEKNLKGIGTLEIERNLRLENLIAKRRARKKWMAEAERNLIDFNGNDGMQIRLPPRRNPFDPPHDSDEIMGLSPVPGSAPSVVLPKFNPFGLPYDQADERRNPEVENSSQQEFVMPPQRDSFFRRYESFTSGASFLGEKKKEKHDFKFRPYFGPEGSGSDSTFSKQLSKSDPKVSRIPRTDMVSAPSIADQEDDNKEVDLLEIVSSPFDAIEELPQDTRAFEGARNQGEEGVENGQVGEPVYD